MHVRNTTLQTADKNVDLRIDTRPVFYDKTASMVTFTTNSDSMLTGFNFGRFLFLSSLIYSWISNSVTVSYSSFLVNDSVLVMQLWLFCIIIHENNKNIITFVSAITPPPDISLVGPAVDHLGIAVSVAIL